MISNRAALAWAVLGVAAFTVYGSLVPFDFRPLRLSVAVNVFRKVLAGGVSVYSRSDARSERDARYAAWLHAPRPSDG